MSPTDPYAPEVIQLAADLITGNPIAPVADRTSQQRADARDIAQAFRQRQIERALGQVDALLGIASDNPKSLTYIGDGPCPLTATGAATRITEPLFRESPAALRQAKSVFADAMALVHA